MLVPAAGVLSILKCCWKMMKLQTDSACTAFAKGILSDAVVTFFSSSRLITLPKPNDNVRPIAIGESNRRLTAKTICFQKTSLLILWSYSTRCINKMWHRVNSTSYKYCLEFNLNWIAMKTDVRKQRPDYGASISSFPDMHNHVIQMYGKPSSLIFMLGTSPVIIASEEGVIMEILWDLSYLQQPFTQP